VSLLFFVLFVQSAVVATAQKQRNQVEILLEDRLLQKEKEKDDPYFFP
jgi:hypothetical protein